MSLRKELRLDTETTPPVATPPSPAEVPPKPPLNSRGLDDPHRLVNILEAHGFKGSGWRKSIVEGWYATQRYTQPSRGGRMGNELSILLESSNSRTVEHVEIEAEIYTPGGQGEYEIVVDRFILAIKAVYPDAGTTPTGVSLGHAIAAKRAWEGDGWKLTPVPYLNGGYGLAFTLYDDAPNLKR